MITRQDLLEAIAECQGVRSPNANTAVKLASFLTILDHMEEEKGEQHPEPTALAAYSFAPDPALVAYDGESEFAKLIDGRPQREVWRVMEELMETLRVMNERLYRGVLRKLSSD